VEHDAVIAELIPAWPLLFAALVAFCVVVYVLADGLDLGVGILFLVAPYAEDRDLMMTSIEPVWDGNETWLVMGGVLLFAIFPAGYYVLLPAFYLPVMFMLFALVFRGAAFEFRHQTERFRWIWDLAFAGGSILAALAQGFILGGLIEGVAVQDGVFAGGPFAFLSLLGLCCGLGLVAGYALLGAGWLIWKTDGPTQAFARRAAQFAVVLVAVSMLLVSAWSALSVPEVRDRWFAWPHIVWLSPVPFVTASVLWVTWQRIWTRHEAEVLLLAIGVFLLGFVGLVISLWPYVVPRSITVWDGLSDAQAVVFVGTGAVFIIPVVLAYQAHAYWVFRGKAKRLDGYDETLRPPTKGD